MIQYLIDELKITEKEAKDLLENNDYDMEKILTLKGKGNQNN